MTSRIVDIIMRLKDAVSAPTKKVTSSFKKLNKQQQLLVTHGKRLGIRTSRLQKGLSILGLEVRRGGKVYDKLTNRVVNTKKAMNDASKATRGFRMEFLGVLFFGMFLLRFATRVTRATVGSFTKILAASQIQGSAIQQLGVNWEFLKFTIGSAINTALTPLLPVLIDIISNISTWVSSNPEVTAGILGLITAIGGGLFTLGTFGLAWFSIVQVLEGFGIQLGTAAAQWAVFKSSLAIGASLTIAWLGFNFIKKGIKEGSIKKQVAGILAMGLGFAGVGAVIGSLVPVIGTGVGAGVGFALGISIGILIDWFLGLKNKKPSIAGSLGQGPGLLGSPFGGIQGMLLKMIFGDKAKEDGTVSVDVTPEINTTTATTSSNFTQVNNDISGVADQIRNLQTPIQGLSEQYTFLSNLVQQENEHMFGDKKKSFPMLWALGQVNLGWLRMRDVAVLAIDNIILELEKIPREIVVKVKIEKEDNGGILETVRSYI